MENIHAMLGFLTVVDHLLVLKYLVSCSTVSITGIETPVKVVYSLRGWLYTIGPTRANASYLL